jgi:voltage-gated sodium channel type II alpha
MNDVINGFYIVEALLRIIGMGFCFGKFTYLKDPFNVFDFVIIILTLIS